MMSNIAPAPRAEIVADDDLAALSTDELRTQLAQALTLTSQNLMRAAAIWAELQRREEPLPPLRSGVGPWLRHIANGQLAAEAVIAFADRRMLLNRIIGMPLDEQRQLAAGKEIVVATINAKGEVVGEEKPLARLNSREIMLAIENGAVRGIQAQIKTVARMMTKIKTGQRARSGYSTAVIKPDRIYGTLQVGRAKVRPEDLADALSALGYQLVRKSSDG